MIKPATQKPKPAKKRAREVLNDTPDLIAVGNSSTSPEKNRTPRKIPANLKY